MCAAVQDGHRWVMMRAVDGDPRRILEARRKQVRVLLRGLNGVGDQQQAALAVSLALQGYSGRIADAQGTVTAYTSVLQDVPLWSIQQACDEVRRGRVAGVNPDFPPSAARLHQVAEEKLTPLRQELRKLDIVLDSKVHEVDQQIPAEERAAVLKGLRETVAQLATVADTESAAEAERRKARIRTQQDRADEALIREYEREGLVPHFNSDTRRPVSLRLARMLGLPLEPVEQEDVA